MRKNLATAIVAVLLSLLALEIGWRFYVANFGTEYQRVFYLYSRAEIDALESIYRPLPFVNYGLSPTRDDINSLGYRGPEIAQPKPEASYRIAALGGSTTYGGYLDTYDLAWPHQLRQTLAADYGLNHVEVVNAGVPAYTSFESAVNFMLRVQDLDPDMIIIYHAVNDVTPRLVDPAYYSGGYEGRGTWRYLDDPLPISALQRLLMHKLGNTVPLAYALNEQLPAPESIRRCQLDTSGEQAVCANLGLTAEQVLAANPPVYFQRNLGNIIGMAQQRDIETLLLTWAYSPYPYDAPRGNVMTHAYQQAAVVEHNAIIRELASQRGVMLYDMAATLPIDREYWYNGVHQSAQGAAEMARQLAAFLVENVDELGGLPD